MPEEVLEDVESADIVQEKGFLVDGGAGEDNSRLTLRVLGKEMTLVLGHCPSASIHEVGTLLWPGSLLLADWLMFSASNGLLENAAILELGAGLGLLPCFVASSQATATLKRFWATDIPDPPGILSLLQDNVYRNASPQGLSQTAIRVTPLDLLDDTHPLWAPSKIFSPSWTLEDDTLFHSSCTMILAADIVYLDDVTEALVSRLPILLGTDGQRSLFLALERRVRFTLPDLVIRAPAVDFLHDAILNFNAKAASENLGFRLKTDCINIKDLPCVFEYVRPPGLELWRIQKVTV